MSISVYHASDIQITESPSGPFIDPNNATIAVRLNQTAILTSATVPPVTKHSSFQKALSSGTGTIDLTSLPDDDGLAGAVTFLNLKIARAIFRNPSTNANSIAIVQGASNGHQLGGSAWKVVLLPGEEWEYKGFATGVTVASGAKTWDLTGTLSQALDVILVAGI